MATASRWAMSDRRVFTAIALGVAGLFILSCGLGMTNIAIGAIGVVIATLGPGFVVLSSVRDNIREYVYGSAEVTSVSPAPQAGSTGRCDLTVQVHARGIDGAAVRLRDPAVPVSKWPDVGAALPVVIPNGNPRRTQVLWDQVRPRVARSAGGETYSSRETAPFATAAYGAGAAYEAAEEYPTAGYRPGERGADLAVAEMTVADRRYDHPPPVDVAAVDAVAAQARREAADAVAEVDDAAAAQRDEINRAAAAGLSNVDVAVAEERAAAADAAAAGYDVPALATVDAGVEATVDAGVEPPAGAALDAAVEPTVGAEGPADAAPVPSPGPPRRRPSPRPRPRIEPADEETVIVATAPVPGEVAPPEPTVVAEPVPPLVVSTAPQPVEPSVAVQPLEPVDAVVPAGGAFIGSTLTAAVAPVEPSSPPPADTGADADAFVAGYLADHPRLANAPGIDHGVHGVSVTLIVSDLGRSLAFYRDTVGLTEIDSGAGNAVLASGEARILLKRVADMPPVDRRVVHLNLEVDDVHAEYERLKAAGVEFVHRPRVVSQLEQLEQWAATFRDPDGHAIAITRWEVRRP